MWSNKKEQPASYKNIPDTKADTKRFVSDVFSCISCNEKQGVSAFARFFIGNQNPLEIQINWIERTLSGGDDIQTCGKKDF